MADEVDPNKNEVVDCGDYTIEFNPNYVEPEVVPAPILDPIPEATGREKSVLNLNPNRKGRPRGCENWATYYKNALEKTGLKTDDLFVDLLTIAHDPANTNADRLKALEMIQGRLFGKLKSEVEIHSNSPNQTLIAINQIPPDLLKDLVERLALPPNSVEQAASIEAEEIEDI